MIVPEVALAIVPEERGAAGLVWAIEQEEPVAAELV